MQAAAKGVPPLNPQAAQQSAGPGAGADGNGLAAPPSAAARMAAVDACGGDARTQLSTAERQQNLSQVQSMSEAEIRDAHDELRKLFSQSSLDFLATREGKQGTQQPHPDVAPAPAMPEPEPEPEPEPAAGGFKPEKGWLHMDRYEPEKLAWTQDVVAPTAEADSSRPIRNKEARFDLDGKVLDPEVDLPTHLGLHHHGDNPHQAGYTLGELVRLIRSAAQQQRTLVLATVAKVLRRAWTGGYDAITSGGASGLPGEEAPSDNVFGALMGMGVAIFIRGALDDDAPRVVIGALEAMAALLVYPGDERFLDAAEGLVHGRDLPPLSPPRKTDAAARAESEADAPSNSADAQAEDIEKCRDDLVAGLIQTQLVVRLRYILKDMPLLRESKGFAETNFLSNLLAVLTRIARHSLTAATAIADCPLLLDAVFDTFIQPGLSAGNAAAAPSAGPEQESWSPELCAAAIKLFRVLCYAGENVAIKTARRGRMSAIAALMVAPDLGPATDRVRTESYRVLRACLQYGMHGAVYVDLYEHFFRGLCELSKDGASVADPAMHDPSAHGSSMARPSSIALLGVLEAAAGWVALRGSDVNLVVKWHHIVHIHDPVIQLVARAAGALPADLAGAGEPSDVAVGQLDLLSAGLALLKSYHDALQKSPEFEVVSSLDLAGRDCDTVLSHPCCADPAQASCLWAIATPAKAAGNVHAKKMTPYRFRFLPSMLQGVAAGAAETRRLGVLNFLVARSDLLHAFATRNKALLPRCAAEFHRDRVQGYVTRAGRLPGSFDRSDMAPYRRQLDSKLQIELVRWSLLTDIKFVTTPDFERLAARLFMLLPPGFEDEARLLLGVVLHLDVSKTAALGVELGVGMAQVLAFYVQRLVGGPLSTTDGLESRLLPQRTISPRRRLPISNHWLLEPLADLHRIADKHPKQHDPAGAQRAVLLVVGCFANVDARDLSAILTPDGSDRLRSLLFVFGLGRETYANTEVAKMLEALWLPSASKAGLNPAGDTSFLRLYQNLIVEFVDMSYGDDTLAKYLLLPMRQRYPVDFRMEAFDNNKFLTLCKVGLAQAAPIMDEFLQPCETDGRLIQMYTIALLGRRVDAETNPVLYWTAVHHLAGFVFKDCGDATNMAPDPSAVLDADGKATIVGHRRHIVAQLFLAASDTLYRHVVFYKYTKPFAPVPEALVLAPSRAELLRSVATTESPAVRAGATQRHPSLLD